MRPVKAGVDFHAAQASGVELEMGELLIGDGRGKKGPMLFWNGPACRTEEELHTPQRTPRFVEAGARRCFPGRVKHRACTIVGVCPWPVCGAALCTVRAEPRESISVIGTEACDDLSTSSLDAAPRL